MLTILRVCLWLGLSDKTIDKIMNIYCKIRYGLSFKEMLYIYKLVEEKEQKRIR